jgi:uncharacterized membrane protein
MPGLGALLWFLAGFVVCLVFVGCALVLELRQQSTGNRAMSNQYSTIRGTTRKVPHA